MTQPRHINYKSDFVLRERFRDAAGKIVPLPDGVDFVLTYTVKHGHTFTASRSGNAYENCLPDGDALLVIFKDHGLCEGTLRRELHLQLINDLMPDGLQNVYFPADPAVELWQFATDSPGVVECDLLAAYTRGLPFTYEDFTPEQLAALKGDTLANTAAKKADTAANEVREQAQNLAATSSEAVKTCNAATQAAKAATGAAETATDNARNAATATNAERELTEQSRQRLEAVADRAEQLAAPIPDGLRVISPAVVTLGNDVPQFIRARVLPVGALQNVIFQAFGGAAGVEPDGRVLPFRPGVARVHVIPTLGTRFYQTVELRVVAPSLRLAAPGALRLDSAGNIRLT